jgi:hypothetical protein
MFRQTAFSNTLFQNILTRYPPGSLAVSKPLLVRGLSSQEEVKRENAMADVVDKVKEVVESPASGSSHSAFLYLGTLEPSSSSTSMWSRNLQRRLLDRRLVFRVTEAAACSILAIDALSAQSKRPQCNPIQGYLI